MYYFWKGYDFRISSGIWELMKKRVGLQNETLYFSCPVLDRETPVTFDCIVVFGQMKLKFQNVQIRGGGIGSFAPLLGTRFSGFVVISIGSEYQYRDQVLY